MPSLKDFRVRINSVKATRKITSAMKMVAASKLRRAQTAAEAARPYADRMVRMLGALAATMEGSSAAPRLLAGNGSDKTHLILLITSDRGLCGGFNGSAVRNARQLIESLERDGKQVKVLCAGRKGRDQLKRDHSSKIIDTYEGLARKGVQFDDAQKVARRLVQMFEAGEFDVCTVVFTTFKSAINQVVTRQQMIPFPVPEKDTAKDAGPQPQYDFEPDEEGILAELLPRNLATQTFRAMLESFASEQGARMTAMDNATRNAGDMLNNLTLRYNRSRQALITKELIEIISGAEAL